MIAKSSGSRSEVRTSKLYFYYLNFPLLKVRSVNDIVALKRIKSAAVIYCDVENEKFNELMERGNGEIIDTLNAFYNSLERDCQSEFTGVKKIESVGKTFVAEVDNVNSFYNGQYGSEQHIDSIKSQAINAAVRFLKTARLNRIPVKIGITWGPLFAGIISDIRPQYLLIGHPINLASRIVNKIETKNIIGVADQPLNSDDLELDSSGQYELKGVGDGISSSEPSLLSTNPNNAIKTIYKYRLKEAFLDSQHGNDVSKDITITYTVEPNIVNSSQNKQQNDFDNSDPVESSSINLKIKYEEGLKGKLLLSVKLGSSQGLKKQKEAFAEYRLRNSNQMISWLIFIIMCLFGIILAKVYSVFFLLIILVRCCLCSVPKEYLGKAVLFVILILPILNLTYIFADGYKVELLQIDVYTTIISYCFLNLKLSEEKDFIFSFYFAALIQMMAIIHFAITLILFSYLNMEQANYLFPPLKLLLVFTALNVLEIYKLHMNKRAEHSYWNKKVKKDYFRANLERMTINKYPKHLNSISEKKAMLNKFTFLYSDLRNFTPFVQKFSNDSEPESDSEPKTKKKPNIVNTFICRLYAEFDKICSRYQLFKLYTVGDSYVLMSNTEEKYLDRGDKEKDQKKQAANLIRASCKMIRSLQNIKGLDTLDKEKLKDIDIRIGIHTVGINPDEGECWGGIMGDGSLERYDVFGKGIAHAQSLEQQCVPGHATISKETFDFIKNEDWFSSLENELRVKFNRSSKVLGAYDMSG